MTAAPATHVVTAAPSAGPESRAERPESAPELLERGLLAARAGAISAALGHLDRAAAAAPALGDRQTVSLLATGVDCRLARGELTQARGLGERLGRYLDRGGVVGATAHHAVGELCAAAGEIERAATHFARVADLLQPAEDDPRRLPWRTSAALTAVRLGRPNEGTTLAREHLTISGALGASYPIALGLRTLATVDPHTDRSSLLRQALDELDGLAAARLVAQVETDLAGQLLLTPGGSGAAEALALLRRAERYAGTESLWPLLGRVRRLLSHLGEEPIPMPAETVATLTATEHRVARLAAAGRTNREIAEHLVVTVKAVEWHLSHVYRKLSIRSRAQLPAVLGSI